MSLTPIITPNDQQTIVGNYVKLDGSTSNTPNGVSLSYSWSIVSAPIGSAVSNTSFIPISGDSSIVNFSPDVTGTYTIKLTISDGIDPDASITATLEAKILLVPHNQGLVPETGFLWNFLSDFWKLVENRERVETIWSSSIMTIASELLNVYQYDYNKSIKDIQELFQRKWLYYSNELKLNSDDLTYILSDDAAGSSAISTVVDPISGLVVSNQATFISNILVPISEGNFSTATSGQLLATGKVLSYKDRSFTLKKAIAVSKQILTNNNGSLPAYVGGSPGVTFTGSGFTPNMVGHNLYIANGADAGSYVIDAYINSTTVKLARISSIGNKIYPATIGSSSLSYSVFSASPNYSVFVADQETVLANASPSTWRLSATLISKTINFEEEGISPGDVIVANITRTDTGTSVPIKCQVVSVDRNRLGWVANTSSLTDGVAADWLSTSDQLNLALYFGVQGITENTNGTLTYSDSALDIKNLLGSIKFRRDFFERELTTDSEINLGSFSVTVKPVSIIRNSKIPVDDKIISVPVLQEYIKQPDTVSQDGKLYQRAPNLTLSELDHIPYILIENQDFIIDSQFSITGSCSITANSSTVSVPNGDLIRRSIKIGDEITVTSGANSYSGYISSVSANSVSIVGNTITVTNAYASYKIKRRIAGNFIRFVPSTFTPRKIAPNRLWAEVSFLDNLDAVEANFGVLVGLTRDQIDSQISKIPYKFAVHGLMYALANGPTISNLRLAAQILLGLPFSQHAGYIREITPNYKLNPDGSPFLGRIVIDATDSKKNLLGMSTIYFYPHGRQISDGLGGWTTVEPSMSGLATNPLTNKTFAIGDWVEQFTPLSNGVKIEDYISTPTWSNILTVPTDYTSLVSRYHTFQLLASSAVVTAEDLSLTANFIKESKPHYSRMYVSLGNYLGEQLVIDEHLNFKRYLDYRDSISGSLPIAPVIDGPSVEEAFITVDGHMFTRYTGGTDLASTSGSSVVTSTSANFDTAQVIAGDLLFIFEGLNTGKYLIGAVDSNTQLSGLTRVDGGVLSMNTLTNQYFSIYRAVENPIAKYTGVSVTNGSSSVTISATSFPRSGVAVGDLMRLHTVADLGGLGVVYTVKAVNTGTGVVTLSSNISESNGTYNITFAREKLFTRYVIGDGTLSYSGTFTNGSSVVTLATGQDLSLFFLQKDYYINLSNGSSYHIVDINPATRTLYLGQTSPFTGTVSFNIEIPGRGAAPISSDIFDRFPGESLELRIKSSGSDLTTTAGNNQVTTVSLRDFSDLGIMSGDFLVIYSGADSSIDVGYGSGIFPIRVVNTTTLTLTRNLTATNNAPGIVYGIERRKIIR